MSAVLSALPVRRRSTEKATAAAPPPTDWWRTDPTIKTWLAGTFEGGGAKGVAYLGALRATKEQGCWFGAVAGASAGAITATLIAAGLDVEALGHQSDVAFTTMRPSGVLASVLRLRTNFGALDNRNVRTWLEGILKGQVEGLRGVTLTSPVTFADLYAATGIELNVVAADVTRSRQIVFNVWDTPRVQVTEAVLASSAIPLAFAPGHLEVPDGDRGTFTHTIVDGGVWANFPTFVFGDRSYRAYSKRPTDVAQDYVVGYLLAEESDPETNLSDSQFRSVDEAPAPLEWQTSARLAAPLTSVKGLALAAAGLLALIARPFVIVGGWLSLGRDPVWRGRWPRLLGPGGQMFGVVDDALSSLHGGLIALGAGIALAVGAWLSVGLLFGLIVGFLDDIRIDMGFRDVSAVLGSVLIVVGLSVVAILVIAITVLTGVLLFVNYVLLGAVRQTGYGVLRTYIAGPGAPIWTGADKLDNVIRLPIPRDLSTLSFDRTKPKVEAAVTKAVQDAHDVTVTRLVEILATPSVAVEPAPTLVAPAPGGDSAAVHPYPGSPLSSFARIGLLSLFVLVIVAIANVLAPTPDWFRYQVNVRFCAEQLATPDGAVHPADRTCSIRQHPVRAAGIRSPDLRDDLGQRAGSGPQRRSGELGGRSHRVDRHRPELRRGRLRDHRQRLCRRNPDVPTDAEDDRGSRRPLGSSPHGRAANGIIGACRSSTSTPTCSRGTGSSSCGRTAPRTACRSGRTGATRSSAAPRRWSSRSPATSTTT
jgi:predicted acylesterase/phospholipase RssA